MKLKVISDDVGSAYIQAFVREKYLEFQNPNLENGQGYKILLSINYMASSNHEQCVTWNLQKI